MSHGWVRHKVSSLNLFPAQREQTSLISKIRQIRDWIKAILRLPPRSKTKGLLHKNLVSRLLTVDFIFIFFFTLFFFFFYFSIFRTTQVRVYQSRCHISHKLMAKSQDWSRDLGERSRRFWNKVTSYNIDNTCWPYVIHMVI